MISERYERQVLLLSEEGQKRLYESKVFIAGAGGLGSPVLVYLALAGVGKIVVADNDTVSLSNLNRQFLHDLSKLGDIKTDSARDTLNRLNPDVEIEGIFEAVTDDNISEITKDCSLIIDCLDNFEARRVLNREAVRTGIFMIHGAVSGWDGQATTIMPGKTPCYECIFPFDKTPSGNFPIVGTTAGVIGSIQANEAVRILAGYEPSLGGKLLIWDGRTASVDQIPLLRNEKCHVCSGLK